MMIGLSARQEATVIKVTRPPRHSRPSVDPRWEIVKSRSSAPANRAQFCVDWAPDSVDLAGVGVGGLVRGIGGRSGKLP